MLLDQHFFTNTLQCVFLLGVASGARIQLYRNDNYTGLIYQNSFTEKCVNFSEATLTHSFRNDACLIRYWHLDCKSTYSNTVLPGNYSAPTGYYFVMRSFHKCNDEDGGSQLNVDITKYYDADAPEKVPDVLEKYRQVCTCINIPDYIQNLDKWSINNHGNQLIAYYQPDCAEGNLGSTIIQAGHDNNSRNMQDFVRTDSVTKEKHKVMSIEPDPDSSYYKSSCYIYTSITQLTSKVSNIEKKLQKAELNISGSQRDIKNLNRTLITKTTELYKKIDSVDIKLNDVENAMQINLNKINDKIQLLLGHKISSEKEIQDFKYRSINETAGLAKKFDAVDYRMEHVKNVTEDKLIKLDNELQLLRRNKNSTQNDITNLQNRHTNESIEHAKQFQRVNSKLDEFEKAIGNQLNTLKSEVQFLSSERKNSQNDILNVQILQKTDVVALENKIHVVDMKIGDVEKTIGDKLRKLKDEQRFISSNKYAKMYEDKLVNV